MEATDEQIKAIGDSAFATIDFIASLLRGQGFHEAAECLLDQRSECAQIVAELCVEKIEEQGDG